MRNESNNTLACHSRNRRTMGITNIHSADSFQGEVLASLKELDRLNQRKASTLATLATHFTRLVHEKLLPGTFVNITDFDGGAYKARVISGTHIQNTPVFRLDSLPIILVDDRALNSTWTVVATPVRAHDMKPYLISVTLQGYVFQGRADIDDSISDNDNILHHLSLWERTQPNNDS